MTYTDWQKLPEAERIERCAKALRWHKLGAFWVDQANNVMADLERKGEWDGWDPLRSRDDCAALIEAVETEGSPTDFGNLLVTELYGPGVVMLEPDCIIDLVGASPDLLAWAACKALEGHD